MFKISYPGTTFHQTAQRKQRGLTLVELLVAITVLGFVALLGWRGLDGIVRARIALNSDLEQTRGMQLTFAQLQSDCAHIANPNILPDRIPLLIGQNRLVLVRTVFADGQPSRLEVVTYAVSNGMLLRRESIATRDLQIIDTLLLAANNDLDQSPAVTLQSGVNELALRAWINRGWQSSINPTVATPNTIQPVSPQSPTGLEVTLRLNGKESDLHKIFLLGPA